MSRELQGRGSSDLLSHGNDRPSLVGGHRRSALDELTDRERSVLSLVAEGRSNRAIANELVLSTRAVERHVQSIFLKLQLPDTEDDNRRVLAVLALLGH